MNNSMNEVFVPVEQVENLSPGGLLEILQCRSAVKKKQLRIVKKICYM